VQVDLVAPTGGDPITGFIVEIFDGVSIVEHDLLALSTTQWTSDTIFGNGAGITVYWYSYYVDPISGLTVTSDPQGATFDV
jgi:hypothetical protein